MSRSFHISGILFLATAFILSLLASVSLPALDLVRVTFGMPMGPPGERALYIHELRVRFFIYYSAVVTCCTDMSLDAARRLVSTQIVARLR